MNRVYVSVGSNVEPALNVAGAVAAMREQFGEIAVSPVYQCRAVGFEGDDFFNLVVAFDSEELPQALVMKLRRIEDAHGRDRSAPRFSPRTLDLDLLICGDLVEHSELVSIPRAEIVEQAFVLAPLADIAPALKHPESGRPIAELWSDFAGDRSLKPISGVLPAANPVPESTTPQ